MEGEGLDLLKGFSWAFGAIAVWLFARKHFDTPGYGFANALKVDDVVFPPHYLTSRLRYRIGRVGYVVSMEILYVAIALLFPLIGDQLVPWWPEELAVLPAEVAIIANFLVAALLLTAFLPNIGPVSAAESRLRAWLHRVARIPEEARRLNQQLETAGFEPEAGRLAALRKHHLEPGVLSSKDTIEGRWARAVCVRAAIEEWGRQDDVKAYMSSRESGWALIEESFENLEPMVEVYRRDAADRAQSFDRELRHSLERLLYRMHRFLSCALLKFEPSHGQRNRRMRLLGFQLEPLEVIGWDQIAYILGGLALWVFIATSLMALSLNASGWARYMGSTTVPIDGVRGSLAWAVTAFLFHGGAVLSVLLIKRWLRGRGRWSIPEAPLAPQNRPWLVYAAMGLVGLGVGMTVLIGAGLLSSGPFQPWWAIMVAVTATLLAYHLDTHPDAAHPLMQLTVQGTATAAAVYVCCMAFLFDGWAPMAPADKISVGFMVAQGTLTGGFIGYWVPARYREFVYRTQGPGSRTTSGDPLALGGAEPVAR